MARILVVEDDVQLGLQLVEWLGHEEHVVELVTDGRDACALLAQGKFDLLILDWELPHKNGLEICRDYRATGGPAAIIMLTGRSSLDDRSAGLDCGADDYLIKPFHLKELSSRIRALLRRSLRSMSGSTNMLLPIGVCPQCGAIYDANTKACTDHDLPLRKDLVDAGRGIFGEKYVVHSVIGRGGMSTVFKVKDSDGKFFAVKVLEPMYIQDQTQMKRFEQEAQILSRLSHPNIVGVYGFATDEVRPYIVMDYIEGRALSRILDCNEEFSLFRCMRIFKQTCEGMAHAHAHGVIHRDLKPGNLLLENINGKEVVQIVDFGVAKFFGEGVEETTTDLRLTKTGEVFGTSMYMSPEQALGREPDPRSDIYSLGCIMYELITGEPPFSGKTALEVLHKQINQSAPPMNSLPGKSKLPPELVRIVQRTLEKSPERRPTSMLDLLRSLDAVICY